MVWTAGQPPAGYVGAGAGVGTGSNTTANAGDHHLEPIHFEREVIGISGYLAKIFERQSDKKVVLYPRDTVQPLFCFSNYFVPHQMLIVKAVIVLFVTVVVSNIVVDWYAGIQP